MRTINLIVTHLAIKKLAHYDVHMRTTLTLDDDLAHALRERARLLNIPFRQAVNDALRRGLSPAIAETPSPEYRVTPHRSGFVQGVDPLKLNQLNDQLDAEAFAGPSSE